MVQYVKMIAKGMKGEPYGSFVAKLMKDGSWFEGMEPSANNPDTKAWQRLHRPKKFPNLRKKIAKNKVSATQAKKK